MWEEIIETIRNTKRKRFAYNSKRVIPDKNIRVIFVDENTIEQFYPLYKYKKRLLKSCVHHFKWKS